MSGLELMFSFGKYSIFLTLLGPIYIFASGEYKDIPKLILSILILFVILTTYMYWDGSVTGMAKNKIWKFLDRGAATAIGVIPLIFGDNDARTYIALGMYFYLLGVSSNWNTHNGHLNHNAFRYLFSIGLILYAVREDQPLYKNLFIGLTTFLFVTGTYLIIKNNKKKHKKDLLIKNDTIIF